MKLLILSDAGSIHTFKWVKGLSSLGIEIFLFSLNGTGNQDYNNLNNVKIFTYGIKPNIIKSGDGNFIKLRYLTAISKLDEIIKKFSPDILHAHYASSYGLLGSLVKFHPYIISVWGSDIFSFPKKSALHKSLLKFNLKNSDIILSTGHIMKNEIEKYIDKDVSVIPFGVDTTQFKPKKVKRIFDESDVVVGIVKSLEKIYGIDLLIKAIHLFKNRNPAFPIKLLIVGGGSMEKSLIKLTMSLGLASHVLFTGNVNNESVADYLNMMDIAVFPSLQESFGVSILEASACEKPVIASDIGGLTETVKNNETGIMVKPGKIPDLVNSLEKLVFSSAERERLGKNGRQFVIDNYEIRDCLDKMKCIYEISPGIIKLNQERMTI